MFYDQQNVREKNKNPENTYRLNKNLLKESLRLELKI